MLPKLAILISHTYALDSRKFQVHDVYRWAFCVTKSTEAAEKFLDEEVDGIALLLIDRKTMLSSMQLKLGPAVKLYAALEKLKSAVD